MCVQIKTLDLIDSGPSGVLVTSPPVGGEKYCDQRVCMSVCFFVCPRA